MQRSNKMHTRNPNLMLVKKNAILLLSFVSAIIVLLVKIIGALLLVVQFIISWIIKIGVRILGLPIYRKIKSIQLIGTKSSNYAQEQFGNNFARNFVVYGGLILASMFVATSNIKARELRPEEVGRNSGMYTLLVSSGDFELVIEEAVTVDDDTQASIPEAPERALSDIGVKSTITPTGQLIEEVDTSIIAGTGDALIKPDLVGTDITPKLRDSIITYVVQTKDTISEVAEQFNVSTNTILWENNIGPRDFIKPGQELVILPVSGVTHTITRGDTLNAIASKYRAKAEDILEVNKLADSSELTIGTKVVVPDGIRPAPVIRYNPPSSSGLADIRSIFKPAQAIAGKLNWPTSGHRITQYFRGWRHSGLDIGVSRGQPVYAADDGVVITSGWNAAGYGYYIIIDHGGGIHTLYGHNNENYAKKGSRVKKGDVIAAVGSTGRSTGPHVHFEVRINGNRVNPLDYL